MNFRFLIHKEAEEKNAGVECLKAMTPCTIQAPVYRTCETVPQVPEALLIIFPNFSSLFLITLFKFIDSFLCHLHWVKESSTSF